LLMKTNRMARIFSVIRTVLGTQYSVLSQTFWAAED